MAKLLDNAALPAPGLRATSACAVVEPGTLPDGSEATTPVVPVVVGEDWQAALLWKALFDAGVYTNVALHPAVPPGGALLRTTLMATHEREHLDRALAIIERTIAASRTSRRSGGRQSPPSWGVSPCPVLDKREAVNEKGALSEQNCYRVRSSPR